MNRLVVFAGILLAVAACDGTKSYTTTVDVLQVERFGESSPPQVGLELRYGECPGDVRRVVRADKAFADCAPNIKAGDKLKAELRVRYDADRDVWRSEITKLGDCAMKLDPKEEANFEMVQSCTEIKTTGVVVGVRCDRTRNKELVEKCPWLKRR